jgi:hypothetical protein
MGEDRKVYKVLVGKPEGKRYSEDPGVRSEWILGKLAGGGQGIQLTLGWDQWCALVKTVMNLQVLAPQN